MDNIGDRIIYWPAVRIIAHSPQHHLKEVLVDITELRWKQEDEEVDPFLTLSEISDQLQRLGYDTTYYVWSEMGLSGEIYCYGNYDPQTWDEHGTTRGYA